MDLKRWTLKTRFCLTLFPFTGFDGLGKKMCFTCSVKKGDVVYLNVVH